MSSPSGQGSRVEVPELRVKRRRSRVKVSSKLSDQNLQLKSYTEKKAKKWQKMLRTMLRTMAVGVSMIIRFPINSGVKGGEI